MHPQTLGQVGSWHYIDVDRPGTPAPRLLMDSLVNLEAMEWVADGGRHTKALPCHPKLGPWPTSAGMGKRDQLQYANKRCT